MLSMKRLTILLFGMLLTLSWLAYAMNKADLLEPDEAFQLTYLARSADDLVFSWEITDGYYLYKNKIKWVTLTPGIHVDVPSMPKAEIKDDPFFGRVEVYHNTLDAGLRIRRQDSTIGTLQIEVFYQGCAEIGVCYLPVRKTLTIDLPDAEASGSSIGHKPDDEQPPFMAEQDRISKIFSGHSSAFIMLSFMGFGLMLAFTPCVFPMIPIISGIVMGQGEGLTTRKAFGLSLCYVLASAFTYTVFGVLAGLFGQNLQAVFQQPFAIGSMSAVFLMLGLSMFGVFNIQVPSFLQTRLAGAGSRHQSRNWYGAAVMGMLSALTIGPCVTAPLAGVLIYIGQSGDAILGGLALFSLGVGMGIPLLLVGTSAERFMPRAGAWMHVTKSIFGVGLLAVGVWLLGRILPWQTTLMLWFVLLLVPLMYLGWKRLWKIAAILALSYGVLFLAGILTRPQRDYLELVCNVAVACAAEQSMLPFQAVGNVAELERRIDEAQESGRWVMLEFHADWCVTCVEMEQTTLADTRVRTALSQYLLLQVDVTEDDENKRALLQHFGLIGPPAILFFGPDRKERTDFRVVGYMDSVKLLELLSHLS